MWKVEPRIPMSVGLPPELLAPPLPLIRVIRCFSEAEYSSKPLMLEMFRSFSFDLSLLLLIFIGGGGCALFY